MKKTFTLLLVALMATCVTAQTKLTLGGQSANGEWSWGWNKTLGAAVSLHFNNQWGEFYLHSTPFSADDYTKYRLTLSTPSQGGINLRFNQEEGDPGYVGLTAGETVFEGTIPLTDVTNVELQATEDDLEIDVESFVLIDPTDVATQTSYSENWGVSLLGGYYTCTSQYGEIMLNGVENKPYQRLDFYANSAIPTGVQLKIKYKDGTEGYPSIAGSTTASVALDKEVKQISIQANASDLVLDLAYVTTTQPILLNEDDVTAPVLGTAGTKGDYVLNRTFSQGWNTLTVPFVITAQKVSQQFGENAKVFKYSGYTDGKVTFEKVVPENEWSWMIDGYEPVLIYIEDADAPAVVNNLYIGMGTQTHGNDDGTTMISPAKWVDNGNGGVFIGSYVPVPSSDLTGNYGVLSDGSVRMAGSSATCAGYHAYLKLPAEAAAKAISLILDDGVVTGISTVVPAADVFGNGAVYNLNGQRVGENLAPGIYVRNGKKFIQK